MSWAQLGSTNSLPIEGVQQLFVIPVSARVLLIILILLLAALSSRLSSPWREILFIAVIGGCLFVRHLIKLGRKTREEEAGTSVSPSER